MATFVEADDKMGSSLLLLPSAQGGVFCCPNECFVLGTPLGTRSLSEENAVVGAAKRTAYTKTTERKKNEDHSGLRLRMALIMVQKLLWLWIGKVL